MNPYIYSKSGTSQDWCGVFISDIIPWLTCCIRSIVFLKKFAQQWWLLYVRRLAQNKCELHDVIKALCSTKGKGVCCVFLHTHIGQCKTELRVIRKVWLEKRIYRACINVSVTGQNDRHDWLLGMTSCGQAEFIWVHNSDNTENNGRYCSDIYWNAWWVDYFCQCKG